MKVEKIKEIIKASNIQTKSEGDKIPLCYGALTSAKIEKANWGSEIKVTTDSSYKTGIKTIVASFYLEGKKAFEVYSTGKNWHVALSSNRLLWNTILDAAKANKYFERKGGE